MVPGALFTKPDRMGRVRQLDPVTKKFMKKDHPAKVMP